MTAACEDDIARSLRRIARALEQYNRRFAERTNLTVSQWLALRVLKSSGSCTAGELADELGISRGITTGILDRLELRSLVRRRRGRKDRRRIYISLTRQGRRTASEIQPPLEEPLARLLNEFSEDTRSQVAEVLKRVAKAFDS